ncbi:MAG: chromate transporter [Elusimicrobia bacterium]|nr:chromate transporter [Elusimicrobiota bacterium]
MILLVRIFVTFFKIGLFAIGGAYSFLPLMEREFVDKYGWLSKSEFMDVWGITSVFPGAICIKFSTYVGYKLAGIAGVMLASLGIILPPALLILGTTFLYREYKDISPVKSAFRMIRIAVFSMIIAAAFKLGLSELVSARAVIMAVCFFVIFAASSIHPAFIIMAAGVLGAVFR